MHIFAINCSRQSSRWGMEDNLRALMKKEVCEFSSSWWRRTEHLLRKEAWEFSISTLQCWSVLFYRSHCLVIIRLFTNGSYLVILHCSQQSSHDKKNCFFSKYNNANFVLSRRWIYAEDSRVACWDICLIFLIWILYPPNISYVHIL